MDKISVVLNCIACFAVIPFVTITALLLQITMSSNDLAYQLALAVPAFTAFTVAASIALRRVRYSKAGFFIQFVGPVLFLLVLL